MIIPFFTSRPSSFRLLSLRVAVCDSFYEALTAILILDSLPLLAVLVVPQLVPDTFPPLHLLQPLPELGEVRTDVVVGLCLVVGPE